MADKSLSEAFVEAPIEDPVLACVVFLRDRLPACDVRTLILDNFAVTDVKVPRSSCGSPSRLFCGRRRGSWSIGVLPRDQLPRDQLPPDQLPTRSTPTRSTQCNFSVFRDGCIAPSSNWLSFISVVAYSLRITLMISKVFECDFPTIFLSCECQPSTWLLVPWPM